MFSTCLAPMVSSVAKLFNYTLIGIILAFILGVIIGFFVPPISTRSVQFHGGYSLYNTGDRYRKIFSHSGRLITDFTVTEGVSLVFVNIGILGLVCTAIIFFFFPVNGPIL